jgi:hypothetical protein
MYDLTNGPSPDMLTRLLRTRESTMSNTIKSRFFFVAVLLSFVSFCIADAPSGIVSFSFDNTQAPVWDLSGGLQIEQQMLGAGDVEVPVVYSVEITHDAKGKLSGSGFTILNVGTSFVAAEYNVTGKTSGGGSKANRAVFTVRLSGDDVIAGVQTKFNMTIRYDLEADAGALSLVGTARGNAKFSELSSGRIESDVTLALAPGMDGSWTVNMDIVPLKKLGGSASIILSNGRVLPAQLSGSYSSSSGVSKVKLTGVNEGKGTSVNLKFFNSEEEGIALDSMNGKILGQGVQQ